MGKNPHIHRDNWVQALRNPNYIRSAFCFSAPSAPRKTRWSHRTRTNPQLPGVLHSIHWTPGQWISISSKLNFETPNFLEISRSRWFNDYHIKRNGEFSKVCTFIEFNPHRRTSNPSPCKLGLGAPFRWLLFGNMTLLRISSKYPKCNASDFFRFDWCSMTIMEF